MIKKRILSILLAAALTASALPVTVSAESETTDFSTYIHAYNRLSDRAAIMYYERDNKLTVGDTYTLSFYAKSFPMFNSADDGLHGDHECVELRVIVNGTEISKTRPSLGSEWTKYTYTFTAANESFELILRGGSDQSDQLPFDVCALKLTEKGSEDNFISNPTGLASNTTSGWERSTSNNVNSSYTYSDLAILEEKDYTTANASAGVPTEISLVTSTTLEPGRYEISADLRLSDIDVSLLTYGTGADVTNQIEEESYNKVNIGLVINSVKVDSVTVDNEWTRAVFTVDVNRAVDGSALKLICDIDGIIPDSAAARFPNATAARSIDYANIKVEKLFDIDDILDTGFADANGTLIERVYGDGSAYIHVYDRATDASSLTYVEKASTLEAGKYYVISFDSRSQTITNFGAMPDENCTESPYVPGTPAFAAPVEGKQVAFRVAYGGNWVWNDDSVTSGADTWNKITTPVILATEDNKEISITVRGKSTAADQLPFDIRNLGMYECDASGKIASGAQNLITSDTNVLTADEKAAGNVSGWYSSEPITEATEFTYSHVDAMTGKATEIYFADDEIIAPGRYHMSGKFRLADVDMSLIDFTAWTKPVDNYNKVNVTLSTVDGEYISDSAAIVNEWGTITLTIDIKAPINKNTLVLKLDVDGIVPAEVAERFASVTAARAIDFYGISFSKVADYVSDFVDVNGGGALVVTGDPNTYVHAYNRYTDRAAIIYHERKNALTIGETYELSFYVRGPKIINPVDDGLSGDHEFVELRVIVNSNHISSANPPKLDSEWIRFTYTFVADSADTDIYFRGLSDQSDQFPFDIYGLTLTKADGSSDNLISNPLGMCKTSSSSGWDRATSKNVNSSYTYSDIAIVAEEDYFLIGKTPGVPTEIIVAGDTELEPGVHHITAEFRLDELDASMYGGYGEGAECTRPTAFDSLKVSAYLGDVQLKTAGGSESVTITNEWTEVVFVIDTKVSLNLNGLRYVLNIDGVNLELYPNATASRTVNFKNISVENINRYLSITPVGANAVILLLLMKQEAIENGTYVDPKIAAVKSNLVDDLNKDISKEMNTGDWTTNAKGFEKINTVLGAHNGSIGEMTTNRYIRAYNRMSDRGTIHYIETENPLVIGRSYEVSFWARAQKIVNPTKGNYGYEGSENYIELRVFNQGVVPALRQEIKLGTEWTKYTFSFTAAHDKLDLYIKGQTDESDQLPFDIDGLSVIDRVTGKDIVTNPNGLSTNGSSGWYGETTTDPNRSYHYSDVGLEVESMYYRVEAGDENTVISYKNDVTLDPGRYTVSGRFRISEIDASKIKYEVTSQTENGNVINLRTVLNGETLLTSDAAETVEVTNEWTTVSFNLDITERMTVSELEFIFDSAITLDVDDLYIGVDPLKEILKTAISEEGLKSWSVGNQTLEFITEDGEAYLKASNITNNLESFTYAPGKALDSGTYRFTAKMRTTNTEGFELLRMNICGKVFHFMITNEWKTLDFTFELNARTPLNIKIYGGPTAVCIGGYEMTEFTLASGN